MPPRATRSRSAASVATASSPPFSIASRCERQPFNLKEDRMKITRPLVVAAIALSSSIAYAQSGPTDPQIAAIVVAANQVDIDAGKLAESKGSNKDVKAFGKQMVTDHTGVNKQAVALVTK